MHIKKYVIALIFLSVYKQALDNYSCEYDPNNNKLIFLED